MPKRSTRALLEAEFEVVEGDVERACVTLALDAEVRRRVTRHGRDSLAASVRGLIRDRVTLFEVPKPAHDVLERDMARHGIVDQRDYVIWLLLERYRELAAEQ